MEGAKIYLTRLLPKPSKLASFHKGGAQSCTNNWLQVNEIWLISRGCKLLLYRSPTAGVKWPSNSSLKHREIVWGPSFQPTARLQMQKPQTWPFLLSVFLSAEVTEAQYIGNDFFNFADCIIKFFSHVHLLFFWRDFTGWWFPWFQFHWTARSAKTSNSRQKETLTCKVSVIVHNSVN